MPKSTILTKSSTPSRLGLDVAVDDPLGMCGGQRAAALKHNGAHSPGVDGDVSAEDVREVFPVEELHDEVAGAASGLAEIGDVDDVLVADSRRALGLLTEAGNDFRAPRQVIAKDLDRHALIDISMKALVDQPHAAFADAAFHHVAAGQHDADQRIVRVDRADVHLRRRHETCGIDGAEYLSPAVINSAGRT